VFFALIHRNCKKPSGVVVGKQHMLKNQRFLAPTSLETKISIAKQAGNFSYNK